MGKSPRKTIKRKNKKGGNKSLKSEKKFIIPQNNTCPKNSKYDCLISSIDCINKPNYIVIKRGDTIYCEPNDNNRNMSKISKKYKSNKISKYDFLNY